MLRILVILAVSTTGTLGLQWSSNLPDGATLYACDGHSNVVTIPWSYSVDPGEQITDTRWFFSGPSDQLVALHSYNNFLPSPSYSLRVDYVPNGGIRLDHVTQADAGNYTVEVNVEPAGGGHATTHRHSVELVVLSASTAHTDASLEVTQEQKVVFDNRTGEYHIELSCTSHGRLPPSVIWTTPSHQTLQSSDKEGNTFKLMLPNPVIGGTYNCRLPTNATAAFCLSSNDSALEGANIFVDDVKARLALVEAGLTSVLKENSQLKLENSALKSENGQLKTDVQQLNVQMMDANLAVNDLKAQDAAYAQRLQNLEELHSKQVIFHARLGSDEHLSIGSHIKPTVVSVNQGGGYSSASGEFTAPISGNYFFTATAAGSQFSSSSDYVASLALLVDGMPVAFVDSKSVSYFEQGTCTYAGHLDANDTVWLASYGDGFFRKDLTTFSGFLVNSD